MLKLSPGQAGDAPHGREVLRAGGLTPPGRQLLMDCAYEGNETQELAREFGHKPVVPPNSKRLEPQAHDQVAYRRRNEIERLFRPYTPSLSGTEHLAHLARWIATERSRSTH